METKIVELCVFTMTAGMTAIFLLFVMHNDLGIPQDAIRVDALLSAAITAVSVTTLSFRR